MIRFTADYIYTLVDERPLVDSYIEVDDKGVIEKIAKLDELDKDKLKIVTVDYTSFLDITEDSKRFSPYMKEKIQVRKTFEELQQENAGEEMLVYKVKGAICPGFVNTHCHVELSYLWKVFKKGTGMAGFIDQINALRNNKSKEQRLADIAFWMDKMYKDGVQALGDISNCADSFEIKANSPMYSRTFLEVFGTEDADCEKVIESVLALKEKADALNLDSSPVPHSVYTMSPRLLRESAREGLKTNFLSFHCEESPQEQEMLKFGSGAMWDNRKKAGMSTPPVCGKAAVEYFIDILKEIHPAPFQENILLVHECCLEEQGADIVKRDLPNAYIALCPLSNIFIHSLLPPIKMMREKNLKLTIGTDSLSSNDDLSIVAELFCLQENFEELTLGEMLTWACKNGAEFLGKLQQFGSLELAKAPGLVAIDNLDNNQRLTTASKSFRLI